MEIILWLWILNPDKIVGIRAEGVFFEIEKSLFDGILGEVWMNNNI